MGPKEVTLHCPTFCTEFHLAGATTYQPEPRDTDLGIGQVSNILLEPDLHNRAMSSVVVNLVEFTSTTTNLQSENASLQSKTRHSVITPEHIARTWCIGLKMAHATLGCKTQKDIRTALHPIQRCYRVDHLALHRH